MRIDNELRDVQLRNPVPRGDYDHLGTGDDADAVLRQITAQPRQATAPKPQARRPVRRYAVAVAATAAAAVVGVQVLSPTDTTGPSRALLDVLNRAAGAADAQAASPASGAFSYLKTKTASLVTFADSRAAGGPFSLLAPSIEERWVSRNREEGRLRSTPDGEPMFPGPRDRLRWVLAGRPDVSKPYDATLDPGEYYAGRDLSTLPTDTDELFEEVQSAAAEASDVPLNAEMVVVIGDWLGDPSTTPQVRSALYRVAGRIEGIELLGPSRDLTGRTGTSIGVTSDYSGSLTRNELIFDPSTGRPLGTQQVLLETVKYLDATPPYVTSASAFLKTGATNSTAAAP